MLRMGFCGLCRSISRRFGLQTISVEQVVSLRSNARLAGLRWATAKSKIWRLTKNTNIVSIFPEGPGEHNLQMQSQTDDSEEGGQHRATAHKLWLLVEGVLGHSFLA